MSDADDDDEDFDVGDYPSLVAGVRFAKSLANVPWFANAGRSLDPELIDEAALYAEALGYPDAEVALPDWDEVAAIAADPDLETRAVEAEIARALADEAAATVGPENVSAALNDAAAAIAKIVPARARARLAVLGLDDEADTLIEAAIDAAYGSSQGALLVVLAVAEEDHVFARKFRLFERGRWPIGIIGHTLHLI